VVENWWRIGGKLVENWWRIGGEVGEVMEEVVRNCRHKYGREVLKNRVQTNKKNKKKQKTTTTTTTTTTTNPMTTQQT
jgi:hypothetical protein